VSGALTAILASAERHHTNHAAFHRGVRSLSEKLLDGTVALYMLDGRHMGVVIRDYIGRV
jgi:hypothetical protein